MTEGPAKRRTRSASRYRFIWPEDEDAYLRQLRQEYRLNRRVPPEAGDFEKTEVLCSWVHGLWKHHGSSTPSRGDPLSILREVKRGRRFRCVEYATVLAGCLNAVGVRARVLCLKTRNADIRFRGAGHVLTESYVRDYGKWVLADPQWDALPILQGLPLSAIELEQTLAGQRKALAISTRSGTNAGQFFDWIWPYLFYLDVPLDNRFGQAKKSPRHLMLVPRGARKLLLFQWMPLLSVSYTHSPHMLYPDPPA